MLVLRSLFHGSLGCSSCTRSLALLPTLSVSLTSCGLTLTAGGAGSPPCDAAAAVKRLRRRCLTGGLSSRLSCEMSDFWRGVVGDLSGGGGGGSVSSLSSNVAISSCSCTRLRGLRALCAALSLGSKPRRSHRSILRVRGSSSGLICGVRSDGGRAGAQKTGHVLPGNLLHTR